MTLATRLNGVLAVVGTIPSGVGPDLLCGELRTDDDQPWPAVRPAQYEGDQPWHSVIRVAPNTERGLLLILAALGELVIVGRDRGMDGRRQG